MSDSRKALKWLGGIIVAGMVIFLLVKYGDRIPPEVWDAVGEAAEKFGWLAVLVVFGLIILIVVTGGGILSPEFWALL